jgi:hypothetical protein
MVGSQIIPWMQIKMQLSMRYHVEQEAQPHNGFEM